MFFYLTTAEDMTIGVGGIHAGTNLSYFTGTHRHPSERMVGALLTADGPKWFTEPSHSIDDPFALNL